MGKSPLPLWTYRAATDPVDPLAVLGVASARPLEGDWRNGFAQVAEALAGKGIVAGSYDDSEIWEVAAMLGSNRPTDDAASPQSVVADPSDFRAPG